MNSCTYEEFLDKMETEDNSVATSNAQQLSSLLTMVSSCGPVASCDPVMQLHIGIT